MRSRIATACARILAGLSAMSAGLWALGRACGDAWAWSQWLFWIPSVAVALGATVALAAQCIVRTAGWRRRASVQAGLLLVALAATAGRSVGFAAPGSKDPRCVEVLQWNTDWPSCDDPRAIDFLAANPSDLVLVSNRGSITSPDLVRAWAGPEARVVGAGPFALVTRMPVLEARQVAVGGKGRQLWWVARFEVAPPAWNGRRLRIAMVDLPSRPTIAKSLVAEGLREACEEGGLGEVDLVAGDFNATDGSVIIDRCFPGFRDALWQAGRGWLATWPRRFPMWKIDHVLMGTGITAETARTLDPGVSHHCATRASLVPLDR